jgi:hypothetical protein
MPHPSKRVPTVGGCAAPFSVFRSAFPKPRRLGRLAAAMKRETPRRQSQIRLFYGKEIAFGRHAWSRLEIKFWSALKAHPLV